MALYGQPNSWQCGPFALKHALLVQGVRAHEDSIARIAGSTEDQGTDEHQLAQAAAHYGANLIITRRRSASTTQRTLLHWLREQPVLLCLDQWDHWVTAVGADDERVAILDSHYDTVLRVEPWEVVLRRMVYRKRWGMGWGSWSWYDLHAVRARPPQGLRLHLTPRGADRLIAAGCLTTWDDQVAQLRPLLSPGAPSKLADSLTMMRMGLPADLGPALDRFVAVADAFHLPGRSLRPERVREVLFPKAAVESAVLPLPVARQASGPV